MATGTNGIATIGELVSGKGLAPPPAPYDSNECPVSAEIGINMGGNIAGSYAMNQLVKYSDVSRRPKTYTLSITTMTAYASLALFTLSGGNPDPAYSYTLITPFEQGQNNYIVTFTEGSGIKVNDAIYSIYPGGLTTIYNGTQYRV